MRHCAANDEHLFAQLAIYDMDSHNQARQTMVTQGGAPGDAGWSFSFEKNPLWQLKLRLQWTGWLQYIISFWVPVIFFLLSRIEVLFAGESKILLPVSQLLFCVALLDILFVKFGLAPPEPLPRANKDSKNLIDLIMSRHSCRSFQRRHLTSEHKEELLKLINHYVKDTLFGKPIRLEFTTAPLAVWPTVNAQQFIVALASTEYSKYAIMDVGRCLEKIVIQAQGEMGLETCWIGPGADHATIKKQLGIDPNKYHPICVCAIGYSSRFSPLMLRIMNAITSRTRRPLDGLFFLDSNCTVPLNMDDDPAFCKMKPAFEACRWAPSSYNAQTTRGVVIVEQQKNDDCCCHWTRVDFYCSKDSKYYATVALGIWQAHWEMACTELAVKGKFEVDKSLESKQVPLYDVSWVFDKPIPLMTRQLLDASLSISKNLPFLSGVCVGIHILN